MLDDNFALGCGPERITPTYIYFNVRSRTNLTVKLFFKIVFLYNFTLVFLILYYIIAV